MFLLRLLCPTVFQTSCPARTAHLYLLIQGREASVVIRASGYTLTRVKLSVDSLLNPCNCKNVWKCKCRKEPNSSDTTASTETTENGLATLARAAALCCNRQSSALHDHSSALPPRTIFGSGEASPENSKRCGSRPSTPPGFSHKKHRPLPSNRVTQAPVPGPSLPPILHNLPSSPGIFHQMPEFPTIPPMSTMKSLAGSGCTCGLRCACPGCVEHRGHEHASADKVDCVSGGCTTCVDWQGGIALPTTSSRSPTVTSKSKSNIHQFLVRAAALPLPPHHRKGLGIDPMNVLVYPVDLFSRDDPGSSANSAKSGGGNMKRRGAAFGLVNVPKMECCGGRCSCPEDGCSCGKSCNGCCGDHDAGKEHSRLMTGTVKLTGQLSQDSNSTSEASKASAGCCQPLVLRP